MGVAYNKKAHHFRMDSRNMTEFRETHTDIDRHTHAHKPSFLSVGLKFAVSCVYEVRMHERMDACVNACVNVIAAIATSALAQFTEQPPRHT